MPVDQYNVGQVLPGMAATFQAIGAKYRAQAQAELDDYKELTRGVITPATDGVAANSIAGPLAIVPISATLAEYDAMYRELVAAVNAGTPQPRGTLGGKIDFGPPPASIAQNLKAARVEEIRAQVA